MKRFFFALAVVFAAGLTFLAPIAGGQTGERVTTASMAAGLDSILARLADRQALIQVDSQWRRARLGNDATLLDSLLGDEWTATVAKSRGRVFGNAAETKARYLADVKSGTRSYESIVEDDTHVRIHGNTAVVSGRATSKGYLNDQWMSGSAQFIRKYTKRLGRWQMTSSSSTAIALKNP